MPVLKQGRPEVTVLNSHGGRRTNHFIKKGFQIDFSIRFLALIIIEAVLLAGLFWYMSLDTLTTSYVGSQLRIENTSSFFFPSMMLSNLIVVVIVGLIGIAGLIFISHKIAGPLYRFEKSLKEMGTGDLSHRLQTRKQDQLTDLADTLNDFTSTIDRKMIDIKRDIRDIVRLTEEVRPYLSEDKKMDTARAEQIFQELSGKIGSLKDITDHFRTSQDSHEDSDSKGPA